MNEPRFDSEVEKNGHGHFEDMAPRQHSPSIPSMPSMMGPSMPFAPPYTPAPPPVRQPSSRPPPSMSSPQMMSPQPMFQPAPQLQASPRAPSALDEIRHEAWVRRRIGFACAILGVSIIVGALGFGFIKLATQSFPERPEQLILAISIVFAEAAVTIAALYVGYSMLTVAERLIVDKRVIGVAVASKTTREHQKTPLPEMRPRMPSYSGGAMA